MAWISAESNKGNLSAQNLEKRLTHNIFAASKHVKMRLIELNLQKIFDLCRRYKVDKLYVFGSILTPRFNDDSDVDMVVDFKKIPLDAYADNYFGLKDALSALLGREVDLLEDKGIRNSILRDNIDRTKQLVYG